MNALTDRRELQSFLNMLITYLIFDASRRIQALFLVIKREDDGPNNFIIFIKFWGLSFSLLNILRPPAVLQAQLFWEGFFFENSIVRIRIKIVLRR